MARIRTVKPELWTNERVATCSASSVLTYIGLFTQADDFGRHRDNAAIIAGVLWPLRAEHTPVHVEDDLTQLAEAGLICRYTGCDGRSYLHITGWREHQKIDRPSQSRTPVCPEHQHEDRCGRCKGPCVAATPRGALGESSPSPRAPVAESSSSPREAHATSRAGLESLSSAPPGTTGPSEESLATVSAEGAGQREVLPDSSRAPRGLVEPSASGSRILDPGSSSPTGREAPEAGAKADSLLAEYLRSCPRRPPQGVLGHLGRIIKQLLSEGIDSGHVRAGLARYSEIQGHPSRLPSLVNDAMNRPLAGAHSAWTNPVDAASAYEEEL
ncbi:hypothetical protein ABZV64_19415 [Streptomyces sp. NPDC004959]|nr:hypothetical protein [Streptomyces sp. NRRL F-5630]